VSLRGDVLAVLQAYAPGDAGQQELRASWLAYVSTHDEACSRHGTPDHVTASALVCSADGDRVLLALHRRAGRWFQTGGHLEASDASLAAGALREGAEESGLDDLVVVAGGPVRLDRHPAPCTTPGARDHLDVQYVAVSAAAGQPAVSEESLDVRWFAWDALPPEADESVRALVTASRGRLVAP
jgi:8-oxo-dGTP pyrophosphatase MutT (NUDIX family)